ncbi:hypothetical protein [Streptomyces gossypiisoli]|uniref:hypothetical protein n=1 Tax=Streptomyces gossypiisoli TaxID=2748864 RepID=UPI0015DA7BFC|nr:hypothetical protein [Streptomyces gossypiisoli]
MTRATTVRDAVALITGVLADPEPALDSTLSQVVEDLEHAEPLHIIEAFTGFTVGLTRELARHTGELGEDVWQGYANHITQRLTEGN